MSFTNLVGYLVDRIKEGREKKRPLPMADMHPIPASDREPGVAYKRCFTCRQYFLATSLVCITDGTILTPEKWTLPAILETVLAERYKVKHWIGQGSLHDVFVVEDLNNAQKYAAKILKRVLGHDKKTVRRYSSEIIQNMSLYHRYIAKTLDHGAIPADPGEQPFCIVEWLSGQTLAEHLANNHIVDTSKLIEIGIAACEALSYAHNRGIVHRDLRPSNIFLLTDRTIKLTDFGLAERILRELDWAQPEGASVTGSIYGDPSYLDPHYALTGKPASTCDIYSFGCILYECLTGSQPFTGENELQVLFGHLRDEPKRVSETRPDLNGTGIDALVRKCLEKEPAKRYQSAQELGDALSSLKSSFEGKN